jgi:hypothetical protein
LDFLKIFIYNVYITYCIVSLPILIDKEQNSKVQ